MDAALSHRITPHGAPRVLLLHGWLTSRAVWNQLIPLLAPVGPVMAVDLPGCGASAGPSPDRIASWVDPILLTLDETQTTSVHVVGHSMGGAIAQAMAVRAPERVESLTLLAPVPASGMDLPRDVEEEFRNLAGNREALRAFFASQLAHADAAGALADRAADQAPHDVHAALAAWTGADFSDDLGRIQTPTAVVAGARDAYLPPDVLQARVVDLIAGATLTVLPRCGHYPQLDDPGATAELIVNHIRQP